MLNGSGTCIRTHRRLLRLTNLIRRDFQKLIFYYYADHYIDFKNLITELYRIYKTRIWLSAINPASFSQHALGTPPSGIGPGALTAADRAALFATGSDPDPHGAIPPYQVGYQTYTPNYPSIPGVANSFAGPMPVPMTNPMTNPMASPFPMPTQGFQDPNQQQAPNFGSGNATPSGEAPPPWQGGMGNYGNYAYGMNWGQPFKDGSLPRHLFNVPQVPPVWGGNIPLEHGFTEAGTFPDYSFGQHNNKQIPEGIGWEFRPGKFRPNRPPGSQKGRVTTQPDSILHKVAEVDPFESTRLTSVVNFPEFGNAPNPSYNARFGKGPEETSTLR